MQHNVTEKYTSAVFRRVRKISKRTISLEISVRLSVRMVQLGSHWTDCHEILYLRICRKSVEKFQVSLKSNKNNGHFT